MLENNRQQEIMTQESAMALRASKCANIIKAICELSGLSLQEAIDVFYKSETAGLIEDGVADLQCRSDKYLATIVLEENGDLRQDLSAKP